MAAFSETVTVLKILGIFVALAAVLMISVENLEELKALVCNRSKSRKTSLGPKPETSKGETLAALPPYLARSRDSLLKVPQSSMQSTPMVLGR
jgi:hypothetical protein